MAIIHILDTHLHARIYAQHLHNKGDHYELGHDVSLKTKSFWGNVELSLTQLQVPEKDFFCPEANNLVALKPVQFEAPIRHITHCKINDCYGLLTKEYDGYCLYSEVGSLVLKLTLAPDEQLVVSNKGSQYEATTATDSQDQKVKQKTLLVRKK